MQQPDAAEVYFRQAAAGLEDSGVERRQATSVSFLGDWDGADNLRPAAEHRAGRDGQSPAGLRDQAIDRGVKRRRVVATGADG